MPHDDLTAAQNGSRPSAATLAGRVWLTTAVTVLLVTLCGLLPWARNRIYLRDFYDYGIVMSGVGRLAAGEHLYRDILSPIQSGIFLLSAAMEKMGGGTFQVVTRGAALLIFFAAATCILVLRRRWPILAVACVTAGVVFASAVQHTIIWYNATGVLCLAFVIWGSALAPVCQRSSWPWHALVIGGLWFGGINKINFQIVALVAACAWTLRAGIIGQARWRYVFATLALWLLGGCVLPFLTEIIWTGASPAIWWHNVIELPTSGRSGDLAQILTWKFHVASPKTFYGDLLLPQIGLTSVVLLLLTAFAVLRFNTRAARWDRLLIFPAVIFAIAASDALHATNNEIGYVSLGATIVFASGLWLGFGLVPRGLLFWGGLVVPSLLIGLVSWQSAWIGQRSQFGHSKAARKEYLPGESIDPAFGYLTGTRLPPELHLSLQNAAEWLAKIPTQGHYPVFYGPGMEWLERIFPAVKPGPTPLVTQWGTTYGPREIQRLKNDLQPGGVYQTVLSVTAWDDWDKTLRPTIESGFLKHYFGEVIIVRERPHRPLAQENALNFIGKYGGGIMPSALDDAVAPLDDYQDSAQHWFLGVSYGTGRLSLLESFHRLRGEAKLHRLPVEGAAGSSYALFRAVSLETGAALWSAQIQLPPGKDDASVPFEADVNGARIDLEVEIPPEFGGTVVGGYRNLSIPNQGGEPGPAPVLRPSALPAESITLPLPWSNLGWRPEEVVLRGGHLTPTGAELTGGGELWLRIRGMLAEFQGEVLLAPANESRVSPIVRVVWSKGARFEIMDQREIPPAPGKINFTARTPEAGGWIGIMIDRGEGTIAVHLNLLKVTPAP